MMQRLKNLVNKIKYKKINKRISNAKYIHIMFNDKFNAPFVNFLNTSFDSKQHLVLCKKWFKNLPFPKGKNVIRIKNLSGLDFSKVEKIICHSLFDEEVINYLYENQNLLKKKAYWMIWGGDLYNATRNEMNDFVRRNFKGYISDTDGDCQVAMKIYNSKPLTFNAGYTFPITQKMIEDARKTIENLKKDYIRIQINNSSDETTIEMLDILSKFKNENIRVITILSYGQTQFKNEIIKKGKEIFADKFEYLDRYLTPSQYAKKLAQNDILILNQNRQQGLGNCFSNLALGSKVFIKSEITTYNHFNSRGIKVYDTNEIKNMTFKEFVSFDENVKQNNIEKSKLFFKNSYLKELWNKVFVEELI